MFWTYAILLMFVLSTLSLSMSALLLQFVERKQIESVSSVAHTIEDWTIMVQVEENDVQSVRVYEQFLQSWGKFTQSDITVINRDGEVFESTTSIREVPDEVLKCIETGNVSVHKSNFDGYYDTNVMSVSFPLRYKDNIIGAIIFNRSMPEVRETAFELLLLFLISAAASIIVAVAIIYIQAKHISAPIARINKAAQSIAKGNFNERVEVTSRDEIGQLASTFNFMASSIEKSESNRRRFISDVSHELRTPMTSITGFVSGILDGTIPDDERDDYLTIVRNESLRLTRLVNDMLEMSKMQSEEFKIHINPFDVNELICETLIGLETKINDKGLDVSVDFNPQKLITLGDKDQIKRVLLNLLDNAVKFSIGGTQIKLKTSIAGGKAHISVANVGEEISPDDLKNIFDRFYKTDKSREIDRTGAGLGLSLVKNILRHHNQPITVNNVKNDDDETYTTTFEFTLELK